MGTYKRDSPSNLFYCVKYFEERIANYTEVKLSRHM